MPNLFNRFCPFFASLVASLEQAFLHLSRPVRYSIMLSTALDFPRSKTQLIAESALLRQQLITLRVHRQIHRPRFTRSDRLWLVLLASRVHDWKSSLLILKPDTLWRWHHLGIRPFWKFKSRRSGGRPRLSTDTIALIRQMSNENALWGAERIRGELFKLDIRVATATIQKYLRQAPRFLIRDRDRKYGQTFTRVAAGRQTEILKTPYRAPKANAICERFLGSVRRECLDHRLIVGEKHLYRVIKEYVLFFNQARPHQGIGQNIPARSRSDQEEERKGKVIAFPILNGLHHDYQRTV